MEFDLNQYFPSSCMNFSCLWSVHELFFVQVWTKTRTHQSEIASQRHRDCAKRMLLWFMLLSCQFSIHCFFFICMCPQLRLCLRAGPRQGHLAMIHGALLQSAIIFEYNFGYVWQFAIMIQKPANSILSCMGGCTARDLQANRPSPWDPIKQTGLPLARSEVWLRFQKLKLRNQPLV